jgi:hypothetical protein
MAGCAGFGAGEACDEELCSLPVAAAKGLVPTDEAVFEDGVEPGDPDAAPELAEMLETVAEVVVEVVEVLVEPAPGSGVNGLCEVPRRCWDAPLVVSATARPAPG